MSETTLYTELIIAGLGGGFLAGFLGIGGGIIYILVLPAVLLQVGVGEAELAQYVIANSIFGTTVAAFSGSLSLLRTRDFYWREVILVGLSAVFTAFLLLFTFVNTPLYSKQLFTVITIFFLIAILLGALSRKYGNLLFHQPVAKAQQWYVITGATSGAMSALSGLGGGTITVPMLTAGLHLDIKRAKSISLGVIFIASLGITIFNLIDQPQSIVMSGQFGYIVFPISGVLSLGVLLGSPLGVWVARRVSSNIISWCFIGFVLVVTLKKVLELF